MNKAPLRRDKEAVSAAQALLGRTEEHPTEVLTGKEWLGISMRFKRRSGNTGVG